MSKNLILVAAVVVFLVLSPTAAVIADYNTIIEPGQNQNTVVSWEILETPSVPFELYISGSGFWQASIGEMLTFEIRSIGDDIEGQIVLGNKTWIANDTDIAFDLLVGVAGSPLWLPGFVVEVGQTNIDLLNETAFASASRISGNWM
ncbi:MAG: hypothetical protein ACFE7R_02270, partial [Candidatus Hodarchaeota archaeon]